MSANRSRALQLLLMAACPLAVTSCTSPAPPQAVQLAPGWNCLATPSSFNGAGFVFEVDRSKASLTVADYSLISNVRSGATPDLNVKKTYKASIGLVAQILKLPVKASASASDTVTVTETFGGAREANVDADGAAAAQRAFYARTDLRPENAYYYVRGAITATSVKYSFDKDVQASIDVTVAPSIGTLNPKGSYSSANEFSYDSVFPTPVNVCIEPQRLAVPRGPSGAAATLAEAAGATVLFDLERPPAVGGRPVTSRPAGARPAPAAAAATMSKTDSVGGPVSRGAVTERYGRASTDGLPSAASTGVPDPRGAGVEGPVKPDVQ